MIKSTASQVGGGGTTFIRKGVYRFKTHEKANLHQNDCLVKNVAETALEDVRKKTRGSSLTRLPQKGGLI